MPDGSNLNKQPVLGLGLTPPSPTAKQHGFDVPRHASMSSIATILHTSLFSAPLRSAFPMLHRRYHSRISTTNHYRIQAMQGILGAAFEEYSRVWG